MKSGDGTRGDPPQSPERCSTAPHHEQYQSKQGSVVKNDRNGSVCGQFVGRKRMSGQSLHTTQPKSKESKYVRYLCFFVCLFVLHSKVP